LPRSQYSRFHHKCLPGIETVFGSVSVFRFFEAVGRKCPWERGNISGWSEEDDLKFGLDLNQVVFS
jgi:hypothetical protein